MPRIRIETVAKDEQGNEGVVDVVKDLTDESFRQWMLHLMIANGIVGSDNISQDDVPMRSKNPVK